MRIALIGRDDSIKYVEVPARIGPVYYEAVMPKITLMATYPPVAVDHVKISHKRYDEHRCFIMELTPRRIRYLIRQGIPIYIERVES